MKKIAALLFLAVLPILATAQDILTSDQDIQSRFFGLELGQTVTEQELLQTIRQNCNAQATAVESDEESTTYRVINKTPFMGCTWDVVTLLYLKTENCIGLIELNKFFPHDFNFAWMDNDSLKTISGNINQSLSELYGQPNLTSGGDLWIGKNGVHMQMGSTAVTKNTNIPTERLEGLGDEGLILSLKYSNQAGQQLFADRGLTRVVMSIVSTANPNGNPNDPDNYRLPEGKTIEDVILQLPGVTIDSLKNVYVDGKKVTRL